MSIEELQNEFRRRNWVEPQWDDPDSAIGQAARRSAHYGFTRRLGAKRFVVTPEGVEALREAESRETGQQDGGE